MTPTSDKIMFSMIMALIPTIAIQHFIKQDVIVYVFISFTALTFFISTWLSKKLRQIEDEERQGFVNSLDLHNQIKNLKSNYTMYIDITTTRTIDEWGRE